MRLFNRLNHKRLVDAIGPQSDLQYDSLTLYGLARYSRARSLIEVGCDKGTSTQALLLALEENGGNELISINPHIEIKYLIEDPNLRIVKTKYTKKALNSALKRITIQFVFINSCEHIDHISFLLNYIIEKLENGGMVVIHDIRKFSVEIIPIIQDNIISEYDHETLEYYDCPDSEKGLGIIQRKH